MLRLSAIPAKSEQKASLVLQVAVHTPVLPAISILVKSHIFRRRRSFLDEKLLALENYLTLSFKDIFNTC